MVRPGGCLLVPDPVGLLRAQAVYAVAPVARTVQHRWRTNYSRTSER